MRLPKMNDLKAVIVYLDLESRQTIETYAKSHGVTRSDAVRTAVETLKGDRK